LIIRLQPLSDFGTGRFVRYAACKEHAVEALIELDAKHEAEEMIIARDVRKDDYYKCSCGKQADWFFTVAVIEHD